jgi:hypothetical protein
MVMGGGARALGANVIVYDVMLCLLIVMMIISLVKMTERLVAIAAMPVLSWVLVLSTVPAFIAINEIVLVMAITSVMVAMTTVPVIKIV